MISVLSTVEEIDIIRDRWNDIMLDRSSSATPFQTADYVLASWNFLNHKGCELYILCYYRQLDSSLQAIFPFYVDKHHTLRFINDEHTDFCDCIISNESVGDYHLWQDVSETIAHNNSVRRICLMNLRCDSPLLPYLRYFLRPAIAYCSNSFSVLNVNPLVGDEHFLDSIDSLNSKERAKLKNVWRKMPDNCSLRIYSREVDIVFPRRELDDLVSAMVSQGLRSYDYFSDTMISLFEELYAAGLLQVYFSMLGDTPVAANLCLIDKTGDIIIDWIALYKDKRNNLDNLLQIIGYISQNGGSINFARGVYKYKIHNFHPMIYDLFTLRWSKSVLGQIRDIWAMSYYQLRQVAKKIIKG